MAVHKLVHLVHWISGLFIEFDGLGYIILVENILELDPGPRIDIAHEFLFLPGIQGLQLGHRAFVEIIPLIVCQIPVFVLYEQVIQVVSRVFGEKIGYL